MGMHISNTHFYNPGILGDGMMISTTTTYLALYRSPPTFIARLIDRRNNGPILTNLGEHTNIASDILSRRVVESLIIQRLNE